jgi:hypothetical protein
MSAVSVPPSGQVNSSSETSPKTPRPWIVSTWVDVVFIVLTPVLAIPAILILYSSWVGVRAETISLIVAAFFATGHHLPGLIRAYGDRELFSRFRWRFLLAPPIVFLAYFPLYTYHYSLYRLVILSWATWHGLMQLYGFVRIYDSKVGSVSRSTAYWDWLLCLCAFVTPQFLRPEQLSNMLGHWYAAGGPLVSIPVVTTARWIGLSFTVAVLIGFTVNFAVRSVVGPKPNPLKLLMLASGIGIWWYAMLGVENLLIGIALFDVCHDVQYLAIVWMINCRRADANANLGRFMKYLFRRGMVLLYLGLITAYGAIAFTGPLMLDGTVQRLFYGVLFTSTILHYYYDGFIWKVRESTNQASLGLNVNESALRLKAAQNMEFRHLLKCAPVLIVLGFLFAGDFLDPSLTTAQKNTLEKRYVETLTGKTSLPATDAEKSWLYSRFEQVQNLAEVVPDDRSAQLQAAIMLANFGRNDEAVERLMKLTEEHPSYYSAQLMLGGILYYLGESDRAPKYFEAALALAKSPEERSAAYRKLGEVDLDRNDLPAAEAKFRIAIQEDPTSAAVIDALRKSRAIPSALP